MTATQSNNFRSPNEQNFEDSPAVVDDLTADLLNCPQENIEINKYEKTTTTGDKYRCDETFENIPKVWEEWSF